MKDRVQFWEGLFEEISEEWTLVGTRCKKCSQIIFPGRDSCLNCLGQEMEIVPLSRNGKLYTYTIVHMPSEHFQSPYSVGWIELPEGIKIFSQIRGWQEQPLETGMDMDLSFETLWEEEEKEVFGYVFRPSGNGGGL